MEEDDVVVQRAKARVGTTIKDKWTIDRLVGVGGMAVVYAATHRNKKRAAIKMLHAALSADPDIRARFLREGYAANSVEHPGVVRVDDDDVAEDGAAFIVMELLEGETVDARCQRKGGRLSESDVLSIADQLLDVLAAAHAKGIVHRDLKPENVFLNREGVLKVLDFGIARVRDLSIKSSATRTGSLMGTPAFMAPEQARGRTDEVDPRTDLWAVGATMFTLLTGRFVHSAETPNEILALAITQRAPLIGSVEPALHPAVGQIVDRALAYERAARFQDAHEMQSAVREAYAALGSTDVHRLPLPSSPEPGPAVSAQVIGPGPAVTTARPITTNSSAPAVKRWWPYAVGAGALTVLGGLAIAVVVARGSGPDAPGGALVSSAPPSAAAVPSELALQLRDAGSDASEGGTGVMSIDDLPVTKTDKTAGPAVAATKGAAPAPIDAGAGPAPASTTTKPDPFSKRR